jgi:long-chain acyl-CoA synthetase
LYENSIDFYSAYYGIVQCGAVIAPLNTFLKERELAHIIKDAQPALIVVSPQSKSLFEGVNTELGRTVPVLVYDSMAVPVDGSVQYSAYHLHEDELAALLYTSGTTGLPKGVMLSSKNCMTNVLQIVSRVHLTEHERILGVLPLFHSFAQNICVWSGLFLGCTVIIVPKIDRRAILAGLQHKPTLFVGVPALFGLLCLMKNAQLNTIKWLVSGGDALPDRIRAAFELVYRRKICNGYGLTEASPVISADLEDVTEPTNNVGEPLFGIRVQIRDEAGVVVPQGSIGALWVAGDNIMLGYYNESVATAKVLVDGWLDTGDLAYVDGQGKIVITGRLKDLIINKGLNIYPQEIENVIASHSNVLRVGVIGRPDEAGEVPIAYVQIKEEEPDVTRHLNDICTKHLATYKIPREFIVSTEDLPMTATSKVDKKVLRVRDAQKIKA